MKRRIFITLAWLMEFLFALYSRPSRYLRRICGR